MIFLRSGEVLHSGNVLVEDDQLESLISCAGIFFFEPDFDLLCCMNVWVDSSLGRGGHLVKGGGELNGPAS